MIARFAFVVLAGCGRVAFDPLGDGGIGGDDVVGDARADAPPPFVPMQIDIAGDIDNAGSTVKLATDGTTLYVSVSQLGVVRRMPVLGGVLQPWISGIPTPGGLAYVNGAVYISGRGSFQIFRADATTGDVATFAGAGTSGTEDGAPGIARFELPAGLCSDGTYLYVADRNNSCSIRRISLATRITERFIGVPGSCTAIDGDLATARVMNPGGCHVEGNSLYFSDGSSLRHYDLASGQVTTLAGVAANAGYIDGTGANARFQSGIAEVTFDGARVLAADSYNYRVRSYVSDLVETLAGNDVDADVAGALGIASMHEPDGLVFTSAGLYEASDLKVMLIH